MSINAVIADGIGKILGVSDDTNETDDAEKTKCESLKASVELIVTNIKTLEDKRDSINADGKVSSDAKTERTTALNAGIEKLAGLEYSESNAVDSLEIAGTVDELVQKSDGIVILDKSRLKEDGTTEKSQNVKDEIAGAVEAINALTYTHDGGYDKEAVGADIKAISDFAAKKIIKIEELEKCIADVAASALSDENKTAMTNELNKGIQDIIATAYSTEADEIAKGETRINNIVANLSAKTKTAIEIAKDRTDGANSQAVNDELDSALATVLAVSDDTSGDPATGMEAKTDLLNELRKLKTDGIKALEKRKADETAGLSSQTVKKLEARFDKAIGDVGTFLTQTRRNPSAIRAWSR